MLRGTSAALLAGLINASPAIARSRGRRSKGRNVLVIGAGMAGLAAAASLRQQGLGVVVLEGDNRIGGRMHTADLGGQPVDLGAQWIEGIDGNPIYQLAQDLNITTSPAADYNSVDAYDITGARWRGNTYDAIETAVIGLINQTETVLAQRVNNGQPDITMAQALREVGINADLDARDQRFIQYVVGDEIESDAAEFTDNLSLSDHWGENEPDSFSGDRVAFPGGYLQLINHFAKGLDIRLGQKVTAIDYSNSNVVVTTDTDRFSARHCLVTLPLGVLQKNVVQFTPALPNDKITAINALRMGVANKVVLRFEKQFWPDEHFFGYTSDIRGLFVEWTNVGKFTGIPILSLWTHGDTARAMEQMTDQEILDLALGMLRRTWGTSVSELKGYLITRWNTNPFSYGSYSAMPVGSTYDHFDAIAKPAGDRLFFAGEATTGQHYGTVHGAY